MTDFLQTVKERVVVYDGAMGTSIHEHNPSLDDYWGKENCNEMLVLSRPDIIRDIHAEFSGRWVRRRRDRYIRRSRRGSGRVWLCRSSLEINLAAARLAKEVAAQFSTKAKPAVRGRFDGTHHKASIFGADYLRANA